MRVRFWKRTKTDRPPASTLVPPEGVALTLPIAGVGVRFSAQLIDIILTAIAATCLVILLALINLTTPQTLMAIAALLFFLIRVPYYVLAELAWNGQTLGKRLMKIKVVSHDGGPLTARALVLRNLMKEAEIFLPGTLLLTLDSATPLASLAAFASICPPFFEKGSPRVENGSQKGWFQLGGDRNPNALGLDTLVIYRLESSSPRASIPPGPNCL